MEIQIGLDELLLFEKQKRTNLVNCLGGFKNPVLIGTSNNSGQLNLAIFNSLFHVGATPPLFGLLVRPDSVARHTLSNIRKTQFFTVNYIHESFYMQAHQTAARYDENTCEWDTVGLEKEYKPSVSVPFVKNSPIKLYAENVREIRIPENDTILLINKTLRVFIDESVLSEDGFIDIEKAGTISSVGLDAYYKNKKINRLHYAKPHLPPRILE